MKKRNKKRNIRKDNLFRIELIFLIITILFSLFGFMLINNKGNLLTGFAEFSIYPEEEFETSPVENITNETYSAPIIEDETETSGEQIGILPIYEDPIVQENKTEGFEIQPTENLSLQLGNESGFGIMPVNDTNITQGNFTKVSYDIEVFANGGRYMCESNYTYAR